jgi:hypothetical protein
VLRASGTLFASSGGDGSNLEPKQHAKELFPLAGLARPFHNNRPAQNWCGQEESDCLIKTKHCDKQKCFLRNVISAQCSECHCDEIRLSAGKRRE